MVESTQSVVSACPPSSGQTLVSEQVMISVNREVAKNSGGKRAGLVPAQVITGNAGCADCSLFLS